ncbi:AraC family transcriptional regulator [Chryseobacterium lactis]|uniref:AraC family transcriptional regulator n=1 Tax=Chryseobacterium lactis TaxID=1241981 RepID=A0A3G6RP01_CHRLC|nr:helix-turn-helix domain-containing protein [Chryseobacterium lactis]AZA81027.1 helix-turn-helix domain-containing protein [Chryseobacterium lactis]AZB06028.1 helix-turn-helix domain-containing protein [Chryseobacterium lactis]PNW14877.1 AraC family transcriptional regulator [Chryseobacterium lactis]
MKIDVKFYKPSNNILNKYIEGFYFISKQKIENPFNYQTFPNNYNIVSIYLNAAVKLEKDKITVSSADQKFTSTLVKKYITPVEVIVNAVVDEITIYFKPAGLNYFIEEPSSLFENDFSYFSPFNDYEDEMINILFTKERSHQLELLEKYWMSKLIKKDLTRVEDWLKDINSQMSIEEIAEKNQISRQYLNKMFQKYVGKSPSEFRKVNKFRNAINQKSSNPNLIGLSLDANFYDQSHFIRNFKELAKINPGLFFNNVDISKENIWMFKE